MSESGERLATVETKQDAMEKRIDNVEQKQDSLSKTVYMMLGGVMVLQVLGTLWIKLGGGH